MLQLGRCSFKLYRALSRGERGLQGDAAIWLCEKAWLNPGVKGCINDFEAYEKVLNIKLHCLLLSTMHEFINTPKDHSDTHSSIYIVFNKKEDSHDRHVHTCHWVNCICGLITSVTIVYLTTILKQCTSVTICVTLQKT